jgi:hypothetical protein
VSADPEKADVHGNPKLTVLAQGEAPGVAADMSVDAVALEAGAEDDVHGRAARALAG